MARLTWQNVAAPDFRGVGSNYERMSRLLGNAAESGQNMLGIFQDAQQHAADRNILQRQMGITDSNQYNPTDVIGSDGANASLDTLRGVGDYAGTLLNRQVTRDTHSQNTQDWDWQNTGRDQMVGNADFLNSARASAAAGDMSFLQDPRMQNIRPDLVNELIASASGLATESLGRDRTQQGMDQNNWRFGREQRNARLSDQTAQIRADMRANGYNLDTWDAYLASRRDLPPEVANAAYAEMMQLSGAAMGGDTGGSLPSRGGSNAGANTNGALSVMTGGATLPNNITTIGEFVDNKSNLLGYNPAGTATGMYQITSDTWQDFAPKALGSNWRDADIRDPQVQDRVAKAIWDDSNGSTRSIRNRWISLSPSQAEGLINRPWEEARDLISQGESSTTASAILNPAPTATSPEEELLLSMGQRDPGRSFRQSVGSTIRAGRQANMGTTGNLLQNVTDNSDVVQVAAAIGESLGEGANIPGIEEEIQKIRDRSAEGGRDPITYAEAGEILRRSLGRSGGIRNLANRALGSIDFLPFVDVVSNNPLIGSIGAGRVVDRDRLDANLRGVLDDSDEVRLGNIEEQARQQIAIAQAEQRRDTAQANLNEARQRAQRRPGIAQHIPRLEEEANRATMAVALLNQVIGSANASDNPQSTAAAPNQAAGGNTASTAPLPPETSASIPSVGEIQRLAEPTMFSPQDWEAADDVFNRRDRRRTDPQDSQTVARIREASQSPQEFVTNLQDARRNIQEGGVSRGERPILDTINRELDRVTNAVIGNRDTSSTEVPASVALNRAPTGPTGGARISAQAIMNSTPQQREALAQNSSNPRRAMELMEQYLRPSAGRNPAQDILEKRTIYQELEALLS